MANDLRQQLPPHPNHQGEDDASYYEKLMDIDLFQTPAEIGDPGGQDLPWPPGSVGQPHQFPQDDEAYEEENPGDGLDPDLDLEEEENYAAAETSSPDQEFILRRGLPDGRDGVAWDDPSRPVVQPINAPGPDPHMRNNARVHRELVLAVERTRDELMAATRQWGVHDGVYRPVGMTVPVLPAGLYSIGCDYVGVFLEAKDTVTDDFVPIPDPAKDAVVQGLRKFRDSQDRYAKHGMVFKRGVMMWGPPGAGKTVVCMSVAREMIAQGDVVLMCDQSPSLLSSVAKAIRAVEPTRFIIALLEDIEQLTSHYGDHALLSLLDGENQVSGICYIATTNYPQRLGARIMNRPSRFDQRVFVDMPTAEARATYLRVASKGMLPPADLARWVADTKGFSIAHLKEMIISILCLDHDYADTLSALKDMAKQPNSSIYNDGFSIAGRKVRVVSRRR